MLIFAAKIVPKPNPKINTIFDAILEAFWGRFRKHFDVFFDEILVVARNAPTLRKYWPCQQNQGSELQLGDDFSNKNAYKNHPTQLIKFWMIFGRILEAKWKVLVAKIL